MTKNKKKHKALWITLLCIAVALAAAILIFLHFGGFSTGESADPAEFAAYAGAVADITVPESARVIALGEATHGNREFQQLKLDVFKLMVERYGLRAFALEGDYGCCEQVNRYIHGGEGIAREAAAAIGFTIYRTEDMAALIAYMRAYNDAAAPGEDLKFYGFDMQRGAYSLRFLIEACKERGVDTAQLEKLMEGEDWSDAFDSAARKAIVSAARDALAGDGDAASAAALAVHCADMLLQNFSLGGENNDALISQRDAFMMQNVLWIMQQEAARGYERIFLAAHNGHVAKYGSYEAMGKLLYDELGEAYYAIGTDFYKTRCNIPNIGNGKRVNRVFYSHDPLANAAKKARLDCCWLDFGSVPPDTELGRQITEYSYMGSLGEGFSWFMRVLPPSYRIFQPPATLYDAMIFVKSATPIEPFAEDAA